MPSNAHAAISPDLDSLSELSLPELQAQWRALTGAPLKGVRRDLLLRAIAYRLQAQQQGGLSAKAHQRLAQLAKTYTKDRHAQPQAIPELRPGCRLFREWQGVMHEVTVLEHGFGHQDRLYKSLSEIARGITGTRWSGPLFFGLKKVSNPVRSRSAAPRTAAP
jgi:hypothetical protein